MARDGLVNVYQHHYRLRTLIPLMKKLIAVAITLVMSAPTSHAMDPARVAPVVSSYAESAALRSPAIQIIDLSTGEVVYSRDAYRERKPASTLKLITAVAAYTYLEPTARFSTSVYMGTEKKSIVIQGSYDPWISYREPEATKMGRTSLLKIGFNSIKAVREKYNGSATGMTIYYSNLWPRDIANLKVFFKKRGLRPNIKRVSTDEAVLLSGEEIRSSQSPDLTTMVNWALMWSDNDVSTNVAKLASQAAGNGLSAEGINKTFLKIFADMGIDSSRFFASDGSGLSGENKLTADLLAKVLVKSHSDPILSKIIDGLPVGGMTGTLRRRFIETSPDAVGLVKAKTGTLKTTVSLAGYVESGDREYAFVIISDQIRIGAAYHARAKAAVDRLLGRLAQPLAQAQRASTNMPNEMGASETVTGTVTS